MEPNDYQPGGDHYKRFGKLQPWDVIIYFALPYLSGNAVKYLLRYQYKADPLEDLEKAKHYIEKEIERLRAAPGIPLSGSMKFITCQACETKGECIASRECHRPQPKCMDTTLGCQHLEGGNCRKLGACKMRSTT